ncbi:MAG: alpha/beta fold hydrolase [Proteobacteria bacterium]|nr:alpha/beta fold hydrolase [Pseudomonadota bacterium]
MQGRAMFNVSPVAISLAFLDWYLHFANSPGKITETSFSMFRTIEKIAGRNTELFFHGKHEKKERTLWDVRFKEPSWQKEPYRTLYKSFLGVQKWWQDMTSNVPGVTPHHENVVSFVGKQMLDILSPSNYPFTNPEVINLTVKKGGMNLVSGMLNLMEDVKRQVSGERPFGSEAYTVGKNLGITPGKVIFRNRLMELIQYSPVTEDVYHEPILIIPAWIMKYYILDLSPENSLVKYLVDKGHTVFMISWKNPGKEDRETDMDDYLNLGIMKAADMISEVMPDRRFHATGYCLGGTLLAIAAAAMARDGDHRIKTMTLLATQVDFTEAGELMLFIDDSQITYLEDIMNSQGYLDTRQMAGAFQILRSNDLVWSRIVHDYMIGERVALNDLMAWNTDTTRMPFKMHSRYLRELFLNNDLFEGRFLAGGRPVAISDIHVPVFLVSTEKDHVAPWASVYKFHLASDAESITFVLTSGGHNAGIISEPGHPGRHYRISTSIEKDCYRPPEAWFKDTPVNDGSWWISWEQWLSGHSGMKEAPPEIKNFLENEFPYDAPGRYVMTP